MRAVDFHVHAFPDGLAPRAVSRMEGLSGITPVLNGSLSSLAASMDAAGIEQSVILSIATKPAQLASILAWSKRINSHTGFDHAYPFVRRADPSRALNVLRKFPRLAFVATRLGAWWDRVPFGSDSPRADQGRSLALLKGLSLGTPREEAILSGNARALLDSPRAAAPLHARTESASSPRSTAYPPNGHSRTAAPSAPSSPQGGME